MRLIPYRGRALATVAIAAATVLAGCDRTKSALLDAPDPDIIDPSNVQSAAGAVAVRNGALSRLRSATVGSESSWLFGGLLADEWASSSTYVQNDETDQRRIQTNNSSVNGTLRLLYRVRTASNQAIELLNKYRPEPASDIAEMYFARGFAEMQLASDFCNGIPLSNGAGDEVQFGDPLSVKDVFTVAAASLDTAIMMSNGNGAAGLTVNRAARIARARALLGISLDNAAAAAALVPESIVPTDFHYDVTSSLTGGSNVLWNQATSQNRYAVSDSLQGPSRNLLVGNAIPFLSAHDPRVPAHYRLSGTDTAKAQDGNTLVIAVDSLWGQATAVALTSGLDARLIEAEAALQAGHPEAMIAILNALRGSTHLITAPSPTSTDRHPGWTTPVMSALTDPGSADGRVNLLFREAAFWQFGRGVRLGNLRRLIRDYGRAEDGSDTFPTGTHYKGPEFGTDVNLPVTSDEQVGNPNFHGCTDRKA